MVFAISLMGVALFIVGVLFGARASRRLLSLDVREGKIVRAKGRAPAELLHDIEDVTERSQATGTIELVIENASAVVRTSASIGSADVQRIRNVVGRFNLPRLRGASKVENRRSRRAPNEKR